MGMDVCGHAATAEVGEYFYANIWAWGPLWHYCRKVYPPCREVAGYYNDGDGLDAERSAELAATLQAHLEAGHTAAYAAICQAEIAAYSRLDVEAVRAFAEFCAASGGFSIY